MKIYSVFEKDIYCNNPVTKGNKVDIYIRDAVDKEIERLKKEKEWQLNQIIEYKIELYFDSYGPGNEGRMIALEETEEEMQQALQERQ